MSDSRLVTAVAVLALLTSVTVAYRSYRSDADLREEQTELARQIEGLRARLTRAAEEAVAGPVAPGDSARVAPTPLAEPVAGTAAASSEIVALHRRIDELEGGRGIEVLRAGTLQRYTQLRGKARAKALEGLGPLVALGDAETHSVVLEALADPDFRVRESAVAVIAENGDAELLAALTPLVDDPNIDVRKELADALEGAPAASAGPVLVKLLDDPDLEVVEDAVKSLGALGYREARQEIASLIELESPKVTGAVGEALRGFGDHRGAAAALVMLAEGLENADPAVRRRAVKEIGQVGGEEARGYLEGALEDVDPDVQREASKRLSKLGF